MLLSTSTGVYVVDYSFSTESASDYYSSTSYEDAYGSQYDYGGLNTVDRQIPELGYGSFNTTLTGVIEWVQLPGLQETMTTTPTGGGHGVGTETPIIADIPGINKFPTCPQPAYTNADRMKRSDGSIGTLKTPSLGINMKVREDEANSSMRKGLDYYSSTSAWDGNVDVCGHNRGTKYVVGSIRDLEVGDTVTYTTIYETHIYSMSMVKIINSMNWSYLQATTGNRAMLITCLVNQLNKKVYMQAAQTNS